MELLKNNSKIENVSLLTVQGAFASLHDDEPVILTVQTMYDLLTLKNLLTSFELKHLGLTITLQTVDIEVIDVVPLVDLQNIYTYRLLCKKSNTDFTPKSWYKQQYITLNNRYGHLTGQLQTVEYTVTNMLGSYGSFSTDSNSDGLADGWTNSNTNWSFSIVNGRQRITSNTTGTTSNLACSCQVTATQNGKIFVKATVQRTRTDFGDRALILFHYSGIYNGLYFDNTTDLQTKYTSFTLTNSAVFDIRLRPFGYFPPQTLTFTSYTDFDNIIAVDLTAMGELPPPLKQFFAPSNIQKWEDFATFGDTNVMCILKDESGNYIVKTGNQWLNDLIPYVENTAVVRLPIYI